MKILHRFLSHGATFIILYSSMAMITAFSLNNNHLLSQVNTFFLLIVLLIVSVFRSIKLNIKWLPISPAICFGIPFVTVDLLQFPLNFDGIQGQLILATLMLSFIIGYAFGIGNTTNPYDDIGIGGGDGCGGD